MALPVRGTNAEALYPLNLNPPSATAGTIRQTVALVDGTGGFTSVCGLLLVPLDSKGTSWSAESTAVFSRPRLWII